MTERLKVNFELTNDTPEEFRAKWNSPEGIAGRNAFILSVLEWECEDDPDRSRFERLKEIWLIKTEV